jgi:hypothetical protein
MRYRTAGLGRWTLWTLAAALPLGCAALLLAWRRRRDGQYEEWWRHRERLRANGHHHDLARKGDLFV